VNTSWLLTITTKNSCFCLLYHLYVIFCHFRINHGAAIIQAQQLQVIEYDQKFQGLTFVVVIPIKNECTEIKKSEA